MILTILFFYVGKSWSHNLADSLFDDCAVEVCMNETVEMDAGGKVWPHYCYKCPEGEDEVIFLREYFLGGWKYVLGQHQMFQGRYLLSIVPCQDVEVDSMGNVWTTWCFQNDLVKFEKMGGRIWVYKQDFSGGYPQLQYRRIIFDSELIQTFKVKFELNLHEEQECELKTETQEDKKSQNVHKNDHNKANEKTKSEEKSEKHEKNSDFKEKNTEKDKKTSENSVKGGQDSNTDSSECKENELSSTQKGNKDAKEDKLVNVSQKVKLDLEQSVKIHSSVEVDKTANITANHIESDKENSYSLDITVSHLAPANDESKQNSADSLLGESSSLLSLTDSDTKGNCEENSKKEEKTDKEKQKNDDKEQETDDNKQKTDDKKEEIDDKKQNNVEESKTEENSDKNPKTEEPSKTAQTKNCRTLEGDRSNRYFPEQFSDSGQKVEFALDKSKNFILSPETHQRIPLNPENFTEKILDSIEICKQYNNEGLELEFEPDCFIKNMFWEVKKEDGKNIKYLRSYLSQDKENGMYLIDCDTGYRLRAFI